MKRLTQAEIAATHRIFNHVDGISGSYYGRKTTDQIKKFVSLNRWIMFPVKNVPSLREGAGFPAPNVYISFDEEGIKDDGKGRAQGWVGVTYNNVEAMKWLAKVLKPKNAPSFINSVQNMGPGWAVYIEQKIKTNYKDSTPSYETIEELDASTATVANIKKAIKKSDANLLWRGDDYQGEPVLWCVTIFSVSKKVREAVFDKEVKKAFDLFIRVLSLR